MAKYRVETDNGVYEVETDEPNTDPSLGQTILAAGRHLLSAPIEAGKELLTNPTEVAGNSGPLMATAGGIAGGPIGAAAGEAAHQFAKAAVGDDVTPASVGLSVGAAGMAPIVLPAIGNVVKRGFGLATDAAGDGWASLTNNTPKGWGMPKILRNTPEARGIAQAAVDMGNEAQPELGKLVEQAARNPIAGAPADVTALPTGEKALATADDVANFPPGPGEAPLDGAKPDTSVFQDPIRRSLFTGTQDQLDSTELMQQHVGKAIEQTLGKYDASGTSYDPQKIVDAAKSMMERDATGEIMTTGPQGKINEAINHALDGVRDFSKGGPIKWSDAARIKTMLQGEATYGKVGLSRAQEAYDQVTTLLKNDIDDQAAAMLSKQGGDVSNYQTLRVAYQKLALLSQGLNNKLASGPTIPLAWKIIGGTYLGEKAAGIVKGIAGH